MTSPVLLSCAGRRIEPLSVHQRSIRTVGVDSLVDRVVVTAHDAARVGSGSPAAEGRGKERSVDPYLARRAGGAGIR